MGKLRHREVKSMDEVPSSLTQMINLAGGAVLEGTELNMRPPKPPL